jgi:hypothetical protein
MTQEELDALMNGGFDEVEEDVEALDAPEELSLDELLEESEEVDDSFIADEDVKKRDVDDRPKPLGYSDETAHHWPLPATDENKMVHQLDNVTKESEEKASQIFDIIEGVSNELMEKENSINSIIDVLQGNIELFTNLNKKFPDVKAFSVGLEKNKTALDDANASLEVLQSSGEAIMSVMDIMQYQDIHRQKIERVINVMRALSNYLNNLFEGRIEDSKRVASAQHIVGDTHNELASNEDIEALLAQFSK